MSDLSAARLRELLSYDPATGVFTRRVSVKGYRAGEVVGCRETTWGYIVIGVDRRKYQAHRLAWLYVYGVWPENDIDHRNGVRTDNRIENLRDVSRSVNLQNIRSPKSTSQTQMLGVSVYRNGRFSAQIKVAGRKRHLGYFDTKEQAHNAYLIAKARFYVGADA